MLQGNQGVEQPSISATDHWSLWLPLVLLLASSYRAVQDCLEAWFAYGTYSAIFTYGAIGVPALIYLVFSKKNSLQSMTPKPVERWTGWGVLALALGCALLGPVKDVRFTGLFIGIIAYLVLNFGWSAPKLLWQELGLFWLTLPFQVVFDLTHNTFFQTITAHGAAFMLNYTGSTSYSDGVFLYILNLTPTGPQPIGVVEVGEACSGTAIGFTLTYLGFLIPALVSMPLKDRVRLSLVGPFMAIFCNTARVAYLLFSKTYWGDGAFIFWHEGLGRVIYSLITMGLYGLVVLILIAPYLAEQPRPTPVSNP